MGRISKLAEKEVRAAQKRIAVRACYGPPGNLVTITDRLFDADPFASTRTRVSIELVASS